MASTDNRSISYLAMVVRLSTAVIVLLASIGNMVNAFSAPNPTIDAPSPTRSYVEIFDPSTNAKVVLLGCLHGSLSSSEDVRYLMGTERTDAVVLELCSTRIEDLARETVDDYTTNVFMEDVRDFWDFIKGTNKKKGPLVATITFMMGIANMLQANMSGIKVGLEFAVALDIAEENGCDVFLGDRRIDRTMERISNLPSVSLEMIKNNTVLAESKSLQTAILGDRSLPIENQISLPRVLFRNKRAVNDLAKVVLPPILIAILFSLSLGLAFDLPLYAEQDSVDLLIDSFALGTAADEQLLIMLKIISSFLTDFVLFVIGYTLVALPAAKVIIFERDICLAKEIQKACCDVSISSGQKNPRIVAVLGMLHVNGVAKQLLDNGSTPKNKHNEGQIV